jgi:nucleotide-binding universal stress UspA family protein
MFKNILLPTDGSSLSEQAIKSGVAFAKEIRAKVTGFYAQPHFYHLVFEDWPTNVLSQEQYERIADEQAKKYLAVIERTAKAAGVPCECLSVTSEAPSEAVVKTAQDKGCDLIFMASHGRRGIRGLLLGSETTKVLTHCKIPVLVYR